MIYKEVLVNANDLSLRYAGATEELFTGLRFQEQVATDIVKIC